MAHVVNVRAQLARPPEELWKTRMLENWPQADIPVRTVRELRAHEATIPAGTLARLVRALGRTSGPERPEDSFEIELGGTVMAVTRADIEEMPTR
jgi:hypothetical protein